MRIKTEIFDASKRTMTGGCVAAGLLLAVGALAVSGPAYAADDVVPRIGMRPDNLQTLPPPRMPDFLRPFAGPGGATVATDYPILVVPVKFADTPEYPLTQEYVEDLFFGRDGEGEGAYPHPSIAQYYDEQSFQQARVVGDVVWPPLALPQDESFYAWLVTATDGSFTQSGCYGFDPAAATTGARYLVKLALNYAVTVRGVDLSKYDWDKDGVVDGVTVLHSETGAEQTSSRAPPAGKGECVSGAGAAPSHGNDDIWSHRAEAAIPVDGQSTPVRYGIFAAQFYDPSEGDNGTICSTGIGVQTHEIGHLFGLLDWYDYTPNGQGAISYGVGAYSLMGYGLYDAEPDNDAEYCADIRPKGLDPQSRLELQESLGWTANIVPVTENTCEVELEPSQLGGKILQVPVGEGEEYFLVEYRARRNFDATLPGDDILIWHVDPSRSNNNDTCIPSQETDCDTRHPRLSLEQADALYDLERGSAGGNWQGDRTDYFNSAESSEFDSDTSPWSRAWDGKPTQVAISVLRSGLGKRYVRVILDQTTLPPAPVLLNLPPDRVEVRQPYLWQPYLEHPSEATWTVTLSLDHVAVEGMTIDSATGVIKWTPTEPGIYDVEMKVTNCSGSVTRPWQIIVEEPSGEAGGGCSCSAAPGAPLRTGVPVTVGLLALGWAALRRRARADRPKPPQ